MMKTYISSLLVVCITGAQTIRAQESLDDVFAQLDAAQGGTEQSTLTAPASAPATVQTAQPAAVQSSDAHRVSVGLRTFRVALVNHIKSLCF